MTLNIMTVTPHLISWNSVSCFEGIHTENMEVAYVKFYPFRTESGLRTCETTKPAPRGVREATVTLCAAVQRAELGFCSGMDELARSMTPRSYGTQYDTTKLSAVCDPTCHMITWPRYLLSRYFLTNLMFISFNNDDAARGVFICKLI
jgi:hypothetical protein